MTGPGLELLAAKAALERAERKLRIDRDRPGADKADVRAAAAFTCEAMTAVDRALARIGYPGNKSDGAREPI